MKEIAFNQLVRPQFEYASCLWNPWTDRNVQMVENIQRLAARFVMRDFRRESSVTSMLNTLRWNTLQQRRLLFQAGMLHKIHHGIINIRFPQHITPVTSSHHLRTHRLSYHQPKYRIDCYLYSFYSRSIRIWNMLPLPTVMITNTQSFMEAAMLNIIQMVPPPTLRTIQPQPTENAPAQYFSTLHL